MPMDSRWPKRRCGFGKTEIAIRAAFKAATDGKQVAVQYYHYSIYATREVFLEGLRTFQ